jgi:hypothetical protein
MWGLEFLAIPACAILFAIKGGQHGFIVNKYRDKNPVLNRILDGKVLSTVGFGLLCLFFVPWWLAITGALGWLLGVAPSIGEDIQAQREGNWKPFFQRGTFLGASITLGLWNPAFILAGMTAPLCLWISDRRSKEWWFYELAQGAVIGATLVLS